MDKDFCRACVTAYTGTGIFLKCLALKNYGSNTAIFMQPQCTRSLKIKENRKSDGQYLIFRDKLPK